MSDEELQGLSSDLDGGRAALLVMCDASEVQPTSEYLTSQQERSRLTRSTLPSSRTRQKLPGDASGTQIAGGA